MNITKACKTVTNCILTDASCSSIISVDLYLFLSMTGAGMQWSNFYKPVTTDDNFNMALVFVMLIVDTIFYAIITWYFDNVLPGEFGLAKPFYFPFSVSPFISNIINPLIMVSLYISRQYIYINIFLLNTYMYASSQ